MPIKIAKHDTTVPVRSKMGLLHLLAVGVSKQTTSSGFRNIQQCENDAVAVRNCFQDVFQLNADPSKLRQLVSKVNPVSKGAIVHELRELASGAGPNDR